MTRRVEICRPGGRDGDVCDCYACRVRRFSRQLEDCHEHTKKLADCLAEMFAAAGAACTVIARHELNEEFEQEAAARGVRQGFGKRTHELLSTAGILRARSDPAPHGL